ncbi:MAG: hypothetical protein O2887_09015 [Bacteroidetes bacterium]|nr:hypothetical protein [Bacteroidota bacterium]MDA1120614.1 hypothetical protein [Bacteroidota bacterium]
MKRAKFILTALSIFPFTLLTRAKTNWSMKTDEGFKVKAGEARFGKHFEMKGVTLNNLDIKISGADTENDLAVF